MRSDTAVLLDEPWSVVVRSRFEWRLPKQLGLCLYGNLAEAGRVQSTRGIR